MLKLIIPMIILIMLTHRRKTYYTSTFNPSCLMLLMMMMMFMSPINIPTIYNSLIFMDLMSFSLMLLTLWITSLMIIASNITIIKKDREKLFTKMIIFLSLILVFAFSMSNLFGFFIFFEASLIPTLILILGWGYQPERLQAGMYFLLYTVTASLPLLYMISLMYTQNNHLQFFLCSTPFQMLSWSPTLLTLLNLGAFLVKMPLYLTHLWLPKAHVEAPVAGSMILAGLLLKLGSYGLLRMVTMSSYILAPLNKVFFSISLTGAVITSLICLRQTDMKSLIAYSSVGHMALIVAGMFSNTSWGWEGALILMIAHGICSSGMFFLAYSTYMTTNSRSLSMVKGLLNMFPALTLLWFLFSAFNMAAPPSMNLAGEIILISSVLSFSNFSALGLMSISFLTAAYSLILYTSLTHGYTNIFMNPLNHSMNLNYLTTTLHLIPMLMILLSMGLVTSWI